MGYAYTPGLTVAEHTVVRKVRRLPLKGRVLVQVGQPVQAHDIVAQTNLPGDVRPINLASKLGIAPEELAAVMVKSEGDPVAEHERLARTRGLWGFFRTEVRSPVAGTVESISHVSGQVIIRGQPTPLEKTAYACGKVVHVEPEESATVEICGTFIQGIFGVGGEAQGILEVLVDSPTDVLEASAIGPQHAGRIIVGGSLVTADAVQAALTHGVKGIVCGGLDDADLRGFLGYELGVAITGDETLGLTLVVTEGFGPIRMATRTFDLLRRRAGLLASIDGTTQIRAGVIRPEVVIPLEQVPADAITEAGLGGTLEVGAALRAIREPYFGRLGRCTGLPAGLVSLPSETTVRVLEVEFDNGERAILPRANVELIKQ